MKSLSVLLIEDNEGDIILSKELLSQVGINNHISVMTDGEDAKKYLSGILNGTVSEKPDWIMLDLNLPKIYGKELLLFIKSNPIISECPVIIYSSSEMESDIAFCIHNKAALYLRKAYSISDFTETALMLKRFLTDYFGVKEQ